MTTVWSGCSPSLYKTLLASTISSTTLLLLISLLLKVLCSFKFLPSINNYYQSPCEVLAKYKHTVISQVVVRGDRSKFDTSVDEEVDQRRFHFGLTRLEIVTADEGLITLSELDTAWDEGILRRTVDEGDTLLDTGDREDS